MSAPITVDFIAGDEGPWRIRTIRAVAGDALTLAPRLRVGDPAAAGVWRLRGVVSNLRYTTKDEAAGLAARQEGLGRAAVTRAALIPIRKSPEWWALAQDERRAILETQSRHIAIGRDYLPAIARRLHHSRDLGEPFDFLTWFEFAPADEPAFDAMLARLRATPEWRFVTREVDIRLDRSDSAD
jgi:hypothetical protein